MTWILTTLLFITGLILIVKGGDAFVDAASWMAEKTGIPKLIIGATVVSLATTLPEMIVSFIAASQGKVDMAVGNAVGSVTANLGLIMGIALICIPAAIKRRDYLVKAVLMLGAAALIALFGFGGQIGFAPSLALGVVFIVAMADNIYTAKAGLSPSRLQKKKTGDISSKAAHMNTITMDSSGAAAAVSKEIALPNSEVVINVIKFVLGAAGIIIGSQLLVDNGSQIALLLQVPERIISVTIIAIGTSLPELVTTLSAVAKKQNSLSIGNIIGANIIDLTLILPISFLISGESLPLSTQMSRFDIPFCLAIGCVALIPALIQKKFTRLQGIIMVTLYALYLTATVFLV